MLLCLFSSWFFVCSRAGFQKIVKKQRSTNKNTTFLNWRGFLPLSWSLPKEIVFAVQSSFSRKTFFCQIAFTFAALHALDVPGSVQHVEQKAVQDRPLAAGAMDHGFGWATTPHKRGRHTNKINSTGRALTGYLLSPSPIRLELLGQTCQKPVDQVLPQIPPCMRKRTQRPERIEPGRDGEKPKGWEKKQSF